LGAKPVTAPAGSVEPTGSAGGGFLSSFANALGIRHPLDTIQGIGKLVEENGVLGLPGTILSHMGEDAKAAIGRARAAYQQGDTQGAIREATGAIPLIGPSMQKGQDQVAAGNYQGAVGTTLGTVLPIASMMPSVQGAAAAATAPIGGALESGATRLMAGKLKPVIQMIRQTPETTGGEGLTAGQAALAQGAVKAKGLTLGAKSESTRADINDLVGQRGAAIADADAAGTKVSTQGLRDTLLQTIRDKVAPGQAEFSPEELVSAGRSIDSILARQPAWLTVAQAEDLKQSILKGIKFGPGTNGTFDTIARKSVGQGARQSIELADTVNRQGRGLTGSPIADLNADMADKIPLLQVLDRGAMYAGRRDAMSGLGEYAAAASGSAGPLALSAIHRASSPIATIMDRLAQVIPNVPGRAALLALLAKSLPGAAPPQPNEVK
jgi:hypothetical protein